MENHQLGDLDVLHKTRQLRVAHSRRLEEAKLLVVRRGDHRVKFLLLGPLEGLQLELIEEFGIVDFVHAEQVVDEVSGTEP